jgi:hypothetical protein
MSDKTKNKIKNIPLSNIVEEYKGATTQEIWIDGVLSNFIYGFLGAIVIVAITLRIDIGVLLAYLLYYFYLGKVVNRPKYVTDLGKFIVFPIPTAVGAFIGYKLAPLLIQIIQ